MTILAEHAYRYALEYLGPKHPGTLKAEGNMAGLYYLQGKHKEAESLCKNNFAYSKEILGEKHEYTLEAMANLASFYVIIGSYREAEPLYINVLKLRKETLGEQHPDTLTSINELAMLYNNQKRYNEAESLLKQALQLRKKVIGKDHPDTIGSINNLALVYQEQGNYSNAEHLYIEAISLSRKILGNEHRETLICLGNLAALYNDQGRYNEAEHLYKEVIRLKEKIFGKDDKETLISINNLAFLYFIQGRYNESEPLYKDILPSFEGKMGKNHPNTLAVLGNYIVLLININRPENALRLMQEFEHRLLSRSFKELYDTSDENSQRLYLMSINHFQQAAFSLANQIPEEKYQRYAAEVLIRWKNLYADETKIQQQLLNLNNTPEAAEIRTQIATTQGKTGQLLRQSNKNELLKQVKKDQAAILTMTRHFRANLDVENVTLERVQSALPPNSGLIEYRLANIADLTNIKKIVSDKMQHKQHLSFIAFLVSTDSDAKKKVIFRDLGSQEDIVNLLKKLFQLKNKSLYFSQQLQKEQPPDAAGLRELIKELDKKADAETVEIYKKILFPFDNQIKNLKQLYIAPDGPLSLLSFASLRLPDGRFLVERQQINQLQTGRDLLADNGGVSGKGMVAVGGVDYGQADKTAVEQTLAAAKPAQRAVRELFRAGVDPLPESKREVQTIGRMPYCHLNKPIFSFISSIMGNNPLQAQLLKAGLISKKQVSKVNQEQYQNRKQKEPVKPAISSAEQAAAAERSRELNRQLAEEKRRHELHAQVRQLIETNRLKRDERGCPYYFVVQDNKIDRIFVAEEMTGRLSRGLLAIVRSKDGVEVVPAKTAQQIAERDPAAVLVLHEAGKAETEEAAS